MKLLVGSLRLRRVCNHKAKITVFIPDEYFEMGSTPNYIVGLNEKYFARRISCKMTANI